MIHWNVSPELVHIGPVVIRWYGLLFAIAFALGYQVTCKTFQADGVSTEHVDRIFVYVFFGTLIGARLGHTLFYEPDVYLRDPIRILKVWEGGLASHGAAIGILTAMYIYCRKYKLKYLWVLDHITESIALAAIFIRIGNLFNSEIIGKPTHVPWAFIFDRIDQIPRHPTQIYEALAYAATFAGMMFLFFKTKLRHKVGFIFGFFLTCIFGWRILVEIWKENQVAFESKLPLDLGQLLSFPLVAIGIYLMVSRWRQPDPAPTPVKKKRF